MSLILSTKLAGRRDAMLAKLRLRPATSIEEAHPDGISLSAPPRVLVRVDAADRPGAGSADVQEVEQRNGNASDDATTTARTAHWKQRAQAFVEPILEAERRQAEAEAVWDRTFARLGWA